MGFGSQESGLTFDERQVTQDFESTAVFFRVQYLTMYQTNCDSSSTVTREQDLLIPEKTQFSKLFRIEAVQNLLATLAQDS